MKKYKTFQALMGANKEYLEALSSFINKEQEHLSMVQHKGHSFGEAIVELMGSKNAMMANESIAPSLRVMQALYYDAQIEELYVDFFQYANDCLGGEVSKLFDEELLVARVKH